MIEQIITIGVYGFEEAGFFEALQVASVDTFCDIRQRRGLRGATYAFANSQRLQARLAELGIHYLHRKDLAPTPSIRRRQQEADKAGKTAKRQRDRLSPVFCQAYQEEILVTFEPKSLLDDLPPGARIMALFCVERRPEACHRSLVAGRLQQAWNVPVSHIVP